MKVTKLTSILAGVVMAASVGLASAGEPVQLTGQQMDSVTAGTYLYFPHYNTAWADADALAFGFNTNTYTYAGTFTAPGVSASTSSSGSCSGGNYFC